MSSNVSTSHRDKQSWNYILRSGLAGGVAGCVAKTVVAPLDRVKILFQASNPDFRKYAGSWSGAFRAGAEIYHNTGLRGLFQGHSATLFRIFPYAGIKFMAYDQAHHTKSPNHPGTNSPPTFTHAYKQIYAEHIAPCLSSPTPHAGQYLERYPLLKFYRGFSVTLAGMIPYAGVSFLCWGFLRSHFLPPNKTGHKPPTPVADLAIGAVSGLIAQTASYPFEIVRRRMQVGGITRPDRWLRLGETVSTVWHSGGWRGFYVGLSIDVDDNNPLFTSRLLGPPGMPPDQKAPESGKEKKTRRRLRLSCVECTKRRQRGVTHLCRWETVPVARPAPARPPGGPTHPSSEQTIQLLRAQIASLEKALHGKAEKNNLQPLKLEPISDTILPTSPSGSSTLGASTENTSPYASPGPDIPLMRLSPASDIHGEDELEPLLAPLNYLQPMMYNTTSTLARLSVGHHGEYIGRGSLICALHAISTGKTSRFLYAKSTDSTSAYRDPNPGLMSNLLIARVENLIHSIPPVTITTALLKEYFTESNWRFGIPEDWFRTACSQMWNVLEYPGPHGLQINANWLSLFFAVLACAPMSRSHTNPSETDNSDQWLSCALMARRIAEDDYMHKPNISLMVSAADGTVLSCLAVPLLCSYLAQRGRVSEAWKLVGNGIRSAEAVGMHRDPEWKQWQVMSKDEVLLRRRAWWGLYIWDKMYSYLLGRPQMLRKEVFDVTAPSPNELNGMRDVFDLGQSTFIQLCAVAGEALENCFSVAYPDFPSFFEMDGRFEHWENNLPPEYQLPRPDGAVSNLTTAELSIIDRQRHTLHTWYLLCRMKLHIAALTGIRQARQLRTDVLGSSKTSILMSMRLIKLQCDAHNSGLRYRTEDVDPESGFPGSVWFFEGCFSLFEAAVALITTLTRYPWADKMGEAEQLVDRAMGVLTQVGIEKGEQREVARMATEALGSLRQESWWQVQTSGVHTPYNLLPPTFHGSSIQAGSSVDNEPSVGYNQRFASMTYSNLFRPSLDVRNDAPNTLPFNGTTGIRMMNTGSED
ncbi:hypothetical protein H0H87_007290 [Tephrocybe sp. NHM501043]|nr:hypothetical protein H0H87_007290 [Tephrocybe sp. NHM501043]